MIRRAISASLALDLDLQLTWGRTSNDINMLAFAFTKSKGLHNALQKHGSCGASSNDCWLL